MHWLLIIRDILRVRFQWSAALPTSVSIMPTNIHGGALLISPRETSRVHQVARFTAPTTGRAWYTLSALADLTWLSTGND